MCAKDIDFLGFFYWILELSENVVFFATHFIIPIQRLSDIEVEIMRKILFIITTFCQHQEGTSRYRNDIYFCTAVYNVTDSRAQRNEHITCS